MQKEGNSLVTYTALSIIAEHDNQQIQALRKVYDPAYERWKPHINVCFPFVHPDKFEESLNLLQEEFKNFKPFQITFRKMDFFPHGTVFLDPETEKNEQLQQIYRKVVKALPHCKANKDYHPHMTAAKFNKQNIVKKHQELEKEWKEWKIRCDGLHIIRRDKDTPFQTAKFVKFLG